MRRFFQSKHKVPPKWLTTTPEEADRAGEYASGPWVHVLYESSRERDELVNRLCVAGLGEVPHVLVDVGASGMRPPHIRGTSRLAARVVDFGRAAATTGVGFLGRRWILVIAAVLALGPLFVLWRLIRGLAWSMEGELSSATCD